MIHLGVDFHKKYSHVVALTDQGEICWDGQVANEPQAFEAVRAALPTGEPVQCVLEAGWNWGVLYDMLEELEMNPKLASTLKTRLIAESFVKTDKIDATVHAQLLRAGMTPLVHVPQREVRDQKNLLRRRAWLVRLRTGAKNRIHSLLDRNHMRAPKVTDIFGRVGRDWMEALTLREPDGKLLRAELELLDTIRKHIGQTENWIDSELKSNELMPHLLTLPGVGKLLAAVIALEVDKVDRFLSASKLCAYSGLVSSTYASGGKVRHGGLIPTCNHHLRFAYVEAAWVAIRVSPFFGSFYQRLKRRIGVKKAIAAVARKLCEISFYCMQRRRSYVEKPYRFRSSRLGQILA